MNGIWLFAQILKRTLPSEIFSAKGRAASIVTSYIEKRNAVERDVDGDSVEHSVSISIDKVWLNILTEISGATHAHLKKKAIVTVDVDLQWYVVFSSIIEATTGFVFSFFLKSASLIFFAFSHLILESENSYGRGAGPR